MDSESDRELIIQIQQGSLEALGLIYDHHHRLVYRTALAICSDQEAASDLLQDTFLRLYRFADRVDPERPLEPWLYRVTANLSYTWVKRQRRWIRPLEEIADWLSSGRKQSPQYIVEQNEESKLVEQAIASLPPAQRVVVALYYINDLSLQEISEILEIPEGTVKSRLYYGRDGLRRQFGITNDTLPDIQYEFT